MVLEDNKGAMKVQIKSNIMAIQVTFSLKTTKANCGDSI